MALQVWLPLNGTLENKGLSNVTVTNNGATVDNNGKIGKCYKISSSHLIVPYTFTSTNLISIALWVKPSSASNWSDIFTFDSSKNRIEKSTTSLYYWYSDSNELGASGTSLFNLEDNIWYHITYTFNGSTSSFYLNGILLKQLNSITNTLALALSGNKIYFGNRISGLTYSGYFNDIRIYDHCLSPKEVKEISKGLILHYKLDGNDIGITIPRNGDLIPDGVELYDYILSNGTLYIDTGYVLKNTDIIDVIYDRMAVGWVFGSRASSGSLYSAITNEDNGNNTYNIRYGNTILYITSPQPTGTVTVHIESGNTKVNGSTVSTTTYGSSFYSGNCYLFTINDKGTAYSGTYGTNKIRRFSIKGVRNMLPCTYLGEPGMWDTVENKFYRNQGTGLFTLGNKITLKEYEYLQSSGTLYIDTLYNPNNNTRVLTELMMTTNGDAQGMFGSYSGNNWTDRSYGLYYAGSAGNAFSNYVSDTVFYRSKIPYNIKHLIDKNKNLLYIDNALVLTHSTATFQASISMHIFKLNFSSLPRYANMRLYTFKIWDNNTLVRDFIPVSYNGTPGLWDKVEWKFYANAGSGNFTLGPEKTVQQDAPIFYDSSGYCNHGSITGTLTTNSDSPRYTKSTQIVSGATISHPLCIKEPEWTCSCWIYPTNLSSYTYLNNLAMGMKITHGTQSLLYINENPAYYRYSHTFELNKWQHIVFVFKHSTRYMAIYKNGVKDIATGPSSGTVPGLSNTITLFTGFTGYVSDYREYCTALSEDDVKELYNTSAFVTNNGVFAEYELYEDNLSDVKKRGLLETANFYENGAESGYALDTDKTRVASNYIISEEFIEI